MMVYETSIWTLKNELRCWHLYKRFLCRSSSGGRRWSKTNIIADVLSYREKNWFPIHSTDFLSSNRFPTHSTDFLLIQQISFSFNRFPSHSTDFLSNNRFPTHSFNIFYQTTDMLQSMILPSPLQTLHFLAIFQPLIFQNQQQVASKKVDFESLDSIPSMLSDRSDLAFQPGSSGHISDHMNRYKLLVIQIQRQILYFVLYKDTSPTTWTGTSSSSNCVLTNKRGMTNKNYEHIPDHMNMQCVHCTPCDMLIIIETWLYFVWIQSFF